MFRMPSDRMLEMLKTHGDPNCDKDGMIWFVSFIEAQGIQDSYDRKDHAAERVEGSLPMAERLDQSIVDIFDGTAPNTVIGLILEFYGKG